MKTTLFVISIANPILIGLYEDEILKKVIEKDGKTSDILPSTVNDILKSHTLDEIIYVNGPGSYMSIKISYLFLKTLSITLGSKFLAVSGFTLNENSPIRALGKKYFFQDDSGEIKMRFLEDDEVLKPFNLPHQIDYQKCIEDTLPNYQLPAV